MNLEDLGDNIFTGSTRVKEMSFLPLCPSELKGNNVQTKEEEEEEKKKKKKKKKRVCGEKQKLCARGHWRPAEDAKLRELVAQFGPRNWNLIAEHLVRRSGKSCRLRWFNQLDPRIIKRAFTEEEEERLLGAHRLYGNRWAMIARLFPGRTDNAVKNHWHVIMARRLRELHPSPNLPTRRTMLSGLAKGIDVISHSATAAIDGRADESGSACTDLSLSPSSCSSSSVRASRGLLSAGHIQFHHHTGEFERREVPIRNVKTDKLIDQNGSEGVGKMDQSAQSDSNSEPSGVESMGPLSHYAENESSYSEITAVPFFIDFLGVGDTCWD